MNDYKVLLDALDSAAHGNRGLTLVRSERRARTSSYRELRQKALGLLRCFQDEGVRPGDKLILLLEDNEQIIDTFWASLYGGIIPVPVAVGTTDEHRRKFFRIFKELGQAWVCTTESVLERASKSDDSDASGDSTELVRESCVFLDFVEEISQPGDRHDAQPGDIAFIQFTSGSTNAPKGVLLTHHNLLTNIKGMIAAAECDEKDSFLSWMPLTHDMGIIGFHLTPLVLNVNQVIIATEGFVRRPVLWLQKASESRSTVLCSPNFGYKHYLKSYKPDKAESLDLSNVRLLFNGAEPISASLAREFSATMASHGLPVEAMFPVYGLAEASLAVSFPPVHRKIREVHVGRHSLSVTEPVDVRDLQGDDTVSFVAVGSPIDYCELRITDDNREVVSDGHVGHIEIRGENVCQGYFGGVVDEQMTFTESGWLDTGDLGFMDDGELVVTGRAKDMLCVHGHNYYPGDLESVAELSGETELGKVAVCGIHDEEAGTDRIVLFVQFRGHPADFAPIAWRLRTHMSRQTGLEIAEVVPVHRIPKTTSGKLQRNQLEQQFTDGEFADVLSQLHEVLHQSHGGDMQGLNQLELQLMSICEEHLTNKNIGVDDNLLESGENSLTLALIYENIDERWPNSIDIMDFFEYPSIRELAGYLAVRLEEKSS